MTTQRPITKNTPQVLLSLLSLFLGFSLGAQTKKIFLVKAGQSIGAAVPFAELYAYSVFTDGLVFFRGGDSLRGRLNINLFTQESEFIGEEGDTSALADQPLIKEIRIGNDVYLFNKGFHKLLRFSKDVRLTKKLSFRLLTVERRDGYGQHLPVANPSFDEPLKPTRTSDLIAREELRLVKEENFFIADENSDFFPATRKNFLRAASRHEDKLSAYFKANKINFNNQADLEKAVDSLNITPTRVQQDNH